MEIIFINQKPGNQNRISGLEKTFLWQGTRPRSGRLQLAHGLQPWERDDITCFEFRRDDWNNTKLKILNRIFGTHSRISILRKTTEDTEHTVGDRSFPSGISRGKNFIPISMRTYSCLTESFRKIFGTFGWDEQQTPVEYRYYPKDSASGKKLQGM